MVKKDKSNERNAGAAERDGEKFAGWAMSSFDLMHGLDVVEDVSLDAWSIETAYQTTYETTITQPLGLS